MDKFICSICDEDGFDSGVSFQAHLINLHGKRTNVSIVKYNKWGLSQMKPDNVKHTPGFDANKRWGNSGLPGVGANSPAMMEARAGFTKHTPDCKCEIKDGAWLVYCPLHMAAPELLEALKDAVSLLGNGDVSKRFKEIISKATGK